MICWSVSDEVSKITTSSLSPLKHIYIKPFHNSVHQIRDMMSTGDWWVGITFSLPDLSNYLSLLGSILLPHISLWAVHLVCKSHEEANSTIYWWGAKKRIVGLDYLMSYSLMFFLISILCSFISYSAWCLFNCSLLTIIEGEFLHRTAKRPFVLFTDLK